MKQFTAEQLAAVSRPSMPTFEDVCEGFEGFRKILLAYHQGEFADGGIVHTPQSGNHQGRVGVNELVVSDYERFEAQCRLWIQRLGLVDYNITFRAMEMPDSTSTQAELHTNWQQRLAEFRFNTLYRTTDSMAPPLAMDALALHEVLHLLTIDLRQAISKSGLGSDHADAADHALITRLMPLLLRSGAVE